MTISAHKKHGFTLVELLVVIAIIGVLAAVVLIAINPARRLRQARDAGRKGDISQMATALQAYFTTNSVYPAGSGSPGGLTELTTTQDLKVIPTQPGGAAYSYSINATTSEAAVYATLEAPTGGTGFWCWRTTIGRAVELSTAAGCSP